MTLGQAPRPEPVLGVDFVPLHVRSPADVFAHPSVSGPEAAMLPPARLHVLAGEQPRSAEGCEPSTCRAVHAVPDAPGFVQRDGEEVFGTLNVVLSSDEARLARLDRLREAVATRADAGVQVATAVCGSGARSRVSPFPGDVDFYETVVVQAYSPAEGDKEVARRIVESAREAERRGLVLAAIQVEDVKYLPGADGIEKQMGWNGRGLRVSGGLDGHLARDLARELEGRPHDFLKLDFVAPVDGCYRDVTKNIRYAVEHPGTGELTARFTPKGAAVETAFEEAYRTPEEAALVARMGDGCRPGGLGDPDALKQYVAMLEREVRHYSKEPHRNPLKVANRLYNRYAALGEWDKANQVGRLLSMGPARAHQVASEMGTLERAVRRGLPLDREAMAGQVASFLERLADADPKRAAALEDDLVRTVADLRLGRHDKTVAARLGRLRRAVKEGVARDSQAFLRTLPEIQEDLRRLGR